MPEFHDFDLEPSRLNPTEIVLNWRQRGADYLFGPHQISDGTLRAMAILTLFLQPEYVLPDVIIPDEPEFGLHPYALKIIAGLMGPCRLSASHRGYAIANLPRQFRAVRDHHGRVP